MRGVKNCPVLRQKPSPTLALVYPVLCKSPNLRSGRAVTPNLTTKPTAKATLAKLLGLYGGQVRRHTYKPAFELLENRLVPTVQFMFPTSTNVTSGNNVTQDEPFGYEVEAYSGGSPDLSYSGTVDLSCSPSTLSLPATITLASGIGTFTATGTTGNNPGNAVTITTVR